MLANNREHIRKLACRRIIASRKENKNSTSVRQFRVPPSNMQAEDYTEIVYWYKANMSEPPILKHVSNEDLEGFVSGQETDPSFLDLSKCPCHTQSTERCVHLVTEASSKVCGEEKRDGFIKSRIESRKLMKSFNSKSEFKLK
ncbi:unnamed protein product [Psylliodes chrysocephalus]|uniref:Uncharacterized protein n=1 Tax=Psylliodes chrysocephalus TaxID=3402493 RepID=A0A9P0D9T9_9CUCU|nr:unnamed protein product [Psylliodes chrysocephala]